MPATQTSPLAAEQQDRDLSASRSQGRPPISAAIICMNEEDNIEACLRALEWCEDIVVVDSGSTDRTLEIVERFGARVIHHPFAGFVEQKNIALDLCEHEWVLALDADEVITPELRAEIEALDFTADGYEIRRQNYLGSTHVRFGTWNPDFIVRLFRRSKARWGGEDPHAKVNMRGAPRLKCPMMHYTYRTRAELVERTRRYTETAALEKFKRGRRTFFGEPAIHWLAMFTKSYLLRLGVLDGSVGLFLAIQNANASYLKYQRIAELQREARARQ